MGDITVMTYIAIYGFYNSSSKRDTLEKIEGWLFLLTLLAMLMLKHIAK